MKSRVALPCIDHQAPNISAAEYQEPDFWGVSLSQRHYRYPRRDLLRYRFQRLCRRRVRLV